MRVRLIVLALAVAAGVLWLAGGGAPQLVAAAPAPAAPAANPCTFPTGMVGSPAETAWRIFVAANCPAPGNQLVWETWIEQNALYPASGVAGPGIKPKRLHGSPLFHATRARKMGLTAELNPSADCNPMSSPPSNVVKGATVCEEVHINPSAQGYISGQGYEVRAGQTKAAKAGAHI